MGDLLISLSLELNKIIMPIFMVTGIIGNILNIAVLIRPTFYPHACSRYLLAAAINNVFYSSVISLYQLLINGYQIEPENISIIICKVMVYAFHVSCYIAPYNIVLASIERYFASSVSVRLRKYSSISVSRWAIGFVIGFFTIFGINSLILTTGEANDGIPCQIPSNTIYNQIYVVIQFMFFAIFAPCLMALFGFLTIRNLRQVRVAPIVVSSHRRNEIQLIRMLLFQVVIYVVLNLPAGITYMLAILPISFKYTSIFYLINTIAQLLIYVSSSTTFIVYIFCTRSYRKELIFILSKYFHIGHCIRIQEKTTINTIQVNTNTVQLNTNPI